MIKMEKFYCEKCKKLTDTRIKKVTEDYKVKDENVTIEANLRYCTVCGEELWDNELDGENLRKAYEEYKKKKSLLSSDDIKKIRSKYDLSQSSFAKLLGFGEKTITRYENGAIQEKVQDNLIRLMSDVMTFEKLWRLNKNELSDKEIKKVERAVLQIKQKERGIVIPIPYLTVNTYKYTINQ